MGNFWADKLGQQAPPPHVQQVPQVPAAPQQSGPTAWWMTPAHPSVQPTPQQGMPYGDSAVSNIQYTYQQLKSMRADQMDQGMMEALAEIELTFDKYNNVCDQCGSTNFLPAGSKVGNYRMPTSKCFECGNSSGALTNSPEPAAGGDRRKSSQHTRQVGGAQGSYGLHHSQLPANMVPRT